VILWALDEALGKSDFSVAVQYPSMAGLSRTAPANADEWINPSRPGVSYR
jgi:hypothetical protein